MNLTLIVAEDVAAIAHHGQVDTVTGEPYIKHVYRVAGLLDSDEEKMVGYLHDVAEDTPITEDMLSEAFRPEIIQALRLLNRKPNFIGSEKYAAYIDCIIDSGNHLALRVKWADLKDHLRPNCPERLRPRYEEALQRVERALERMRPRYKEL